MIGLRSTRLSSLLLSVSLISLFSLVHQQAWSASQSELALTDPLAFVQQWQTDVAHSEGEISLSQLKAKLASYRVIHVGEIHHRYADHLVQLALLQSLHQQHPELAIGVEWFQQDFQPWLDAYILGRIDEAELLHQTQYYQRWRFDYRLLQPIMRYAKTHQLRVLALNAPNELTRQVSSLGRHSLSLEQRARMPKIHPPGEAQQQRLSAFFSDKIPPDRDIEDYIFAQRIWDETMAANAVRFLQQYPQHKLLVFAGNFHIAHQEAIPKDIARRLPALRDQQLTISSGGFEHYQQGRTDYYVYTDPIQLPPHGRLGAELNTENATIEGIVAQSAAEKAGFELGERIIQFNQTPIRHYPDLILALSQTEPGQQIELQLKSGEHTRIISVILD